jgi:hypothetical protein
MLIVAVGLREVPDRPLRFIVAATAQNRGARVLVLEFVGPLPDISNQIHDVEWTRAQRVSSSVVWASKCSAFLWNRHRICSPVVTPGI